MKRLNQIRSAPERRGATSASGACTPRAFTMLELLAVMLIMIIVMGIAIPVFNKLTMGTGVDASARVLGSQLRLARQHAITQREHVALLLPNSNLSDVPDSTYVAFRPCVVDSSRVFQSWIDNTKWEFVPLGTIIAQVDASPGLDSLPLPSDSTASLITAVPGATASVRAVVFRPTGRIHAIDQRAVTLGEGMVANSVPQLRNAANIINIVVDQYTGRISFEQ